MKSKRYDPSARNTQPFIYLVPDSKVYKCQGRGLYGFGVTMRDAYNRWLAKVGRE